MNLEPRENERRVLALAAVLTAATALLPFLRGVLAGHAFYIRDLSRYFFPVRRYVVEGLLQGDVRYWNPLVHEGAPLTLPPISYPPDLLQMLLPDERGFSLLLALHLPLAALAFMRLARGLGLSPAAAAGGGLVYALGGFGLSCLNLYVFLQAVAWAPLAVLGLSRAAQGGPRQWAEGGLATAIVLSTTGIEVAGQAVLFGIVLSGARSRPAPWLKLGVSLGLACGLAATTLFFLHGLIGGSERAAGLATDTVLGYSVHPVAFGQVLIGSLFGDPSDLVNRFWGGNFFPGFPYFASLYLGATALTLALVGARSALPFSRRALALALVAAAVCLGVWARLDILVDAIPLLRHFRYPAKAFFTVHLAVALLAAAGLDALGRGDRRAWRGLVWVGLPLGGILVAAPLLPLMLPGASASFRGAFFPADFPELARGQAMTTILRDAAAGGVAALALGGLGLLSARGRLGLRPAVLAAVGLVAGDLLRSGAGLNPMLAPSFFDLSPEMSRVATDLRTAGGRLFTCEPQFSPAFQPAARAQPRGHEVWSVATYRESLTPLFNMASGTRTAYGRDLTMLVPIERVLPEDLLSCISVSAIASRLRRSGVSHLLSLSPLEHPDLRLSALVTPHRIAPVALHLYSLDHPLPLRGVAVRALPVASAAEGEAAAAQPGFQEAGGVAVEGLTEAASGVRGRLLALSEAPGRIEIAAEADSATVAVVRDAYARGWTARVNGSAAPVWRADGRHCAVPIGKGTSHVTLDYAPPHLRAGIVVSLGSAVMLILLWLAPWFGRRARVSELGPA